MENMACVVCVLMSSDGVMADDVNNAVPADTEHVDSESHNSNATSVPSYQYDSSGMTELSLATDEVRYISLVS